MVPGKGNKAPALVISREARRLALYFRQHRNNNRARRTTKKEPTMSKKQKTMNESKEEKSVTKEILSWPHDKLKREFIKANPKSTLARLLKEGRVGRWNGGAYPMEIVFIYGTVEEAEDCVTELSDSKPGQCKIDLQGRQLDGMFFPFPSDSGEFGVIQIDPRRDKALAIGILAHEAVHAANWVLYSMRAPHDFGSREEKHAGEPVAYLVGSIVMDGLNVFRPDLGNTSIVDIFRQAMFFNLVRKANAKKKRKQDATDDEESVRPAASLNRKH